MSRRIKAKQLEVYDGTQERRPPVWTDSLKSAKRKGYDDAESGSAHTEKKVKLLGAPGNIKIKSF